MKTYKKTLKEVEEIDIVVCNCCGKEIKTDSHGYTPDHLSVEKRWSYHSCFDNSIHSFDICQDCYQKIIDSFKLPINKN